MSTTHPEHVPDPATEARTGYIAGLRQLAYILESNPDLPLPFDGTVSALSVFTHNREDLVAWAKAFPGRADKQVDDDDNNFGFALTGRLGSIEFVVHGQREQVCERIVTGTREVTREVPDPEALAAVPTVTVTETVEDVTWECRPLLADAPVSA